VSRAHVAQRDADFREMLSAIDALRARHARETRRVIIARFASTCPNCSRRIATGDVVAWRQGAKPIHRECFGGTVERGRP
jgi:predicted SprT family Zn-dependent metalloprotease